eukprot:TRINITY_DN2211_c0_g1_i1.p1 TRINITY_DN2211_c0_g1~~TRINITY_DN2211_c0_g1_i1.p1  ORF type:complete len:126 (-),score=15.76 TRINITY_DN2211_c0_g1_i1:463-840(-)
MSNLHEYSRADLAQFFHMPITQAAREIGVCATVLKKMCRKNGIPRWPHRKIKSINKMIDTLHQSLPTSTPEDAVSIRFEIETLEKHKEHIMQHPEISRNFLLKKTRVWERVWGVFFFLVLLKENS